MVNIWSIHEEILMQLEGMEKKIREKAGEQIEDANASAHNRGLLVATVTIKIELTRVFKAFRDQKEVDPLEEKLREMATPEEKSKHEEVDGLLGADEEYEKKLRKVNPRDERMMDKLK